MNRFRSRRRGPRSVCAAPVRGRPRFAFVRLPRPSRPVVSPRNGRGRNNPSVQSVLPAAAAAVYGPFFFFFRFVFDRTVDGRVSKHVFVLGSRVPAYSERQPTRPSARCCRSPPTRRRNVPRAPAGARSRDNARGARSLAKGYGGFQGATGPQPPRD